VARIPDRVPPTHQDVARLRAFARPDDAAAFSAIKVPQQARIGETDGSCAATRGGPELRSNTQFGWPGMNRSRSLADLLVAVLFDEPERTSSLVVRGLCALLVADDGVESRCRENATWTAGSVLLSHRRRNNERAAHKPSRARLRG